MVDPPTFAIEVNVPAMKTRLPITSMSVISPLLIRGVSVRGVVGISRVSPGVTSARVAVVRAAPSAALLPVACAPVWPATPASRTVTVAASAGTPATTIAPVASTATARSQTRIETTLPVRRDGPLG